jgi:hypothetical protein
MIGAMIFQDWNWVYRNKRMKPGEVNNGMLIRIFYSSSSQVLVRFFV